MKRQNKGKWRERWKVIIRLKVAGGWKGKWWKKVGKNVIIKKKKVNVKRNCRKIGKKNDNDVKADIIQLERNNNKCYTSVFRCI